MSALLPFESLATRFAVGDRVVWRRILRGGYGFAQSVPGRVVRIGQRITIEVQGTNGGAKRVAVSAFSLSPAPGEGGESHDPLLDERTSR